MINCACWKTYTCLACEKAERTSTIIIRRAERRTPKPRKEAQCGTRAGYNKHRRLGEETCAECREAQNIATQRWQKLNKLVG